MFEQSGLGEQQVMSPEMMPGGIYLAQVLEVVPQEHAVRVLLAMGSAAGNILDNVNGLASLKCKVLEHRAGPYVGDLDLPRQGDWGLVVFPNGSDQMAVWLGSLYQDFTNLATKNQKERISHHDSGVYWRVAKDGTVEFSHPSGTFIRLGAETALSPRTRQERQGETRREKTYGIPAKSAITLHIKHSSGTFLTVDPAGKITIYGVNTKDEIIEQAVIETYRATKHETVVGNLTEDYQADKTEIVEGNVTEDYRTNWGLTVALAGTVEVMGSLMIKANDVTLMSTHPSPGLHMHLGGATGEDWIAMKAALDKIKTTFDAHTHPGVQPGGGNTGAPAAMPAFVQDTDYSGQAKAT